MCASGSDLTVEREAGALKRKPVGEKLDFILKFCHAVSISELLFPRRQEFTIIFCTLVRFLKQLAFVVKSKLPKKFSGK